MKVTGDENIGLIYTHSPAGVEVEIDVLALHENVQFRFVVKFANSPTFDGIDKTA